ncbi:MAG: hypothetical protein V1492_04335 [Candidatus Micrarchaeota archaeon]
MKTHLLISLGLFLLLAGCLEDMIDDTTREALEKNDPTICTKANDTILQSECLVTYATSKNDPSACLIGKNPEECVSSAAIKNQKISYCDVLKDPVQKYTCIVKVTGDKTGRSIEELISSWKDKGRMDSCFKQCEREWINCDRGCRDNILLVDNCKNITDTNARSECNMKMSKEYYACTAGCENARWNDCVPPCKTVGN